MDDVFLDGVFVSRDEARVSAHDAGFQHGVGLFETMLAVGGDDGPRVLWLGEHMSRLTESAGELGLSDAIDPAGLGEAVLETVRRSGLAQTGADMARVRLTMTGGDLNMLTRAEGSRARPTVLIQAQPATVYPEPMFTDGVAVVFADTRANPLDPMASHKTLNYWWRLRELQSAAGKGAGEAVVLQVTNHVCGGCVSNLFVVRNGVLSTPIARGEEVQGGTPSPVLPGVTRARVIEWAQSGSLGFERRMLTVDDLLDADEVFATNSSWGVLPIVRVEREGVGDGKVGEVTRMMRERWLCSFSVSR